MTFLLPLVTQLPVFFGSTVVFSRLCQSPTPFDMESFLTLSNLSHVDPTTTLPIVLGFITLANVESSQWFMTASQREKKAAADAKFKKDAEAGVLKFEWSRTVKPALRFASVGRVILASMVPGVSVICSYRPRPVADLLAGCRALLGLICYVWFASDVGI